MASNSQITRSDICSGGGEPEFGRPLNSNAGVLDGSAGISASSASHSGIASDASGSRWEGEPEAGRARMAKVLFK